MDHRRATLRGYAAPWEIPRFIRANELSLEAMNRELLALDLRRSVPRVDTPVAFLLGGHDRQVDSRLAADYFQRLQAPSKRLVWFERSAHNIPFEQPDRFNEVVGDLVGAVASRLHRDGTPVRGKRKSGSSGCAFRPFVRNASAKEEEAPGTRLRRLPRSL